MSEAESSATARLSGLLADSGMEPLRGDQIRRFSDLLSLIIRWNARVNLTSIRTEEGVLSRHFVESIACARALPVGIATLLDFGSGAGFPGIPIAICRPEIAVTLAESQGKKAAFLQEALRVLGLSAKVYSGRAETIGSCFDCVTLRAVDRMPEAVAAASAMVVPGGWLALMTSGASLPAMQASVGTKFTWNDAVLLPGSDDRVLALAQSSGS
jgi:16S rRNA (guanine527-N7)-methyltransferase